MADQATFRIWRGDNGSGKFVDYTTEISERHGGAGRRAQHSGRRRPTIWPCAGIARRASADRARRRSTASRG